MFRGITSLYVEIRVVYKVLTQTRMVTLQTLSTKFGRSPVSRTHTECIASETAVNCFHENSYRFD